MPEPPERLPLNRNFTEAGDEGVTFTMGGDEAKPVASLDTRSPCAARS